MNSGVVRQNVRAGTTTYGFVSYSDLQSYVKDEVYVANGLAPDSGTGDSAGGSGGGGTVTPPTQNRQSSTDVTQSVIITVTLMLIVEGALLFIYVYSKFKSKDAHIKKLDSTSNLIYKLNVKK
ncbi:hypothetical protein D8X55_00565 [Malacoplasma penetrans]|nr:hypothetical protein [Malacoplasma penetrans]RXY97181.1 hypothetical protein D8X55_00565 [Malacoplasma penetrans]